MVGPGSGAPAEDNRTWAKSLALSSVILRPQFLDCRIPEILNFRSADSDCRFKRKKRHPLCTAWPHLCSGHRRKHTPPGALRKYRRQPRGTFRKCVEKKVRLVNDSSLGYSQGSKAHDLRSKEGAREGGREPTHQHPQGPYPTAPTQMRSGTPTRGAWRLSKPHCRGCFLF